MIPTPRTTAVPATMATATPAEVVRHTCGTWMLAGRPCTTCRPR